MKTILVRTDFSKNSENAIDYAISIAKKEKYKVILLHAYHPIISPPSFDLPVQYYSEAYESIQKKASDKLRGVLKIKMLIISGLKQENEKLNCVHL